MGGRPFLAYLLGFLGQNGIRDVVLCTGYLHSQIEAFCGDGRAWGVQVGYSCESEPLGTAGALCAALPLVRSDPVLVLNGDSFVDLPLAEAIAAHAAFAADGTVVAVHVDDAGDFGALDMAAAGGISGFREKGQAVGPAAVNAGVYLFSRRFMERMAARQGRPLSLERDVLPEEASAGNLRAFVAHGYFLDIGTPERYARALVELPEVIR